MLSPKGVMMKKADQLLEEAMLSLISPANAKKPWLDVVIDDNSVTEYGGVAYALTQTLLKLVRGEIDAPDAVQSQLNTLIKNCGTSLLARSMTSRRLRLAVDAKLIDNTVLYRKVAGSDPPSYVISARV